MKFARIKIKDEIHSQLDELSLRWKVNYSQTFRSHFESSQLEQLFDKQVDLIQRLDFYFSCLASRFIFHCSRQEWKSSVFLHLPFV